MHILDAEATVMPWGVHQTKTLGAIAAEDVTYFDYLLSVQLEDMFLRDAIAAVASKHGRTAKRGSKSAGGAGQLQLFSP